MILEVRNLKKYYGGISAVNRVSFGLEEGEVSSIIGPNGAGKTTLFNLITGKITPNEGKIFFKKNDISRLAPHEICKQHIGRSFQITNIFPKFTAFENIQIAILSAQDKNKNFYNRANRITKEETVMEILESLGIADKKDVLGGFLSHGDQKRLDIGIALASHPEILLLDEPTAGMSPEETLKMTNLIQRVAKEKGLTILLIEHDMGVVFKISELIRVLHQGTLIACGTPEEIKNNEEVQRVYLGKE